MKFPTPLKVTDAGSMVFSFDAFDPFIKFLKDEIDFWTAQNEKLKVTGRRPAAYVDAPSPLVSMMATMVEWKEASKSWDEAAISANLTSYQNNQIAQLSGQWLWSGHSFIPAWMSAYNFSQTTGDAFFELVVNKTANSIGSFEYLRGYLLAYEFLMQDESLIIKRRGAERASFNTLKDQLVATKSELVSEVTDYQTEINEWKTELTSGLESWQGKHVKNVDDTTLRHSTEFQDRLSAWTERVIQLESLYQEKLRLDSPASYWAKSATKFKKQGFYWVGALVLISITAIVYFSYFFASWLLGFKTEVKLNTLEGIVLFGVIISSFAVLIRTFSRLSFSAFHLQRDSEEREQLTHLYLALSKDTEIDSDSRNIVLQALFSRTETGLLANESGPAMPGIHDIVSSLAKKS